MKYVNAKEIGFFAVVDNVLVIADGKAIPFEWKNKDNEHGGNISLYDLQEQLEGKYRHFMVIHENPMRGSVYRFNNYGEKEWLEVGTMCGYA